MFIVPNAFLTSAGSYDLPSVTCENMDVLPEDHLGNFPP